jgi:hypothetical protein
LKRIGLTVRRAMVSFGEKEVFCNWIVVILLGTPEVHTFK